MMQVLSVVTGFAASIWWIFVGVRYCIGESVPAWVVAFGLFACAFYSAFNAMRAAIDR